MLHVQCIMWDLPPAKETDELLVGLADADLLDPLTAIIDPLTFDFVFPAVNQGPNDWITSLQLYQERTNINTSIL